jgi:hypothetical protein
MTVLACQPCVVRTVVRAPAQVKAVVQPPAAIVARLVNGQGPSGPAGADGVGDANHLHPQPVAAAVWDITHNLSKYPSVTVVDSAGDECEGAVEYLGANALRVTFSAPFAGTAYLN